MYLLISGLVKKAAPVDVFGGQLRYFGGTVAFIRGVGYGYINLYFSRSHDALIITKHHLT